MGVYELFVPGAQKGQMYKFIIVTEQGDKLYNCLLYTSESYIFIFHTGKGYGGSDLQGI